MGTLLVRDVGPIVRDASQYYICHTLPDGSVKCPAVCVANKTHMQDLINELEQYTDLVQAEADREGLTADTNIAQWAKDMGHWRDRLAGYQRALARAQHTEGDASCEELRDTVTLPLVAGWFRPGTPGIVNPEVQSVADIATPYMLGNQVVVYRDFQRENFQRLVDDMVENAKQIIAGIKKYAPKALDWGLYLAYGAGIMGAAYLTLRVVRWHRARKALAAAPPPTPNPLAAWSRAS